ncbi:hypothetical protein OGAPHI_002541 [Ogataea philodendri]|uniref:Uncharacterized protein n=1 Tax=Ogataea philodendri TaxID=1378263 RepID=A0A9P8PBL5_9ASCO|nr:uncharacterized protein OGAPHI_002541 [Ogataea philodendri]KAH3668786.1 hypothetical protein OGAPHI_002541 [Ogataea philodendri]
MELFDQNRFGLANVANLLSNLGLAHQLVRNNKIHVQFVFGEMFPVLHVVAFLGLLDGIEDDEKSSSVSKNAIEVMVGKKLSDIGRVHVAGVDKLVGN